MYTHLHVTCWIKEKKSTYSTSRVTHSITMRNTTERDNTKYNTIQQCNSKKKNPTQNIRENTTLYNTAQEQHYTIQHKNTIQYSTRRTLYNTAQEIITTVCHIDTSPPLHPKPVQTFLGALYNATKLGSNFPGISRSPKLSSKFFPTSLSLSLQCQSSGSQAQSEQSTVMQSLQSWRLWQSPYEWFVPSWLLMYGT